MKPDLAAFREVWKDVHKPYEGKVWPAGIVDKICAAQKIDLRRLRHAPRPHVGLRVLDTLLAWFIAALVAFLVAIVTSQLVDRHLFEVPLAAPDQFVRVGLIWLTFVGFAAAIGPGRTSESISSTGCSDPGYGPLSTRCSI